MRLCAAIFAHDEERRIGTCLTSLPLDRADIDFHVLVNGSSDRTAERARLASGGRANVHVHDLRPGGKSRTWNHFVHELWDGRHDVMVFMDGDAEIAPGSLDALADMLAARPQANAASAMPLNGRRHRAYQRALREEGGLFGDLYALRGDFLRRMRSEAIRLPDDLIGDDGLIAALAATDLQADAHWDRERVAACEAAGFYCEPVGIFSPRGWRLQYRRMISYSVRHFQNRIISAIMRRDGPAALPPTLAPHYAQWLPSFGIRRSPVHFWFDRLALQRMRRAAR